jgi:hypothetical protein
MNTHHVLAELVARTRCKPGWTFGFSNADGLCLVITVPGLDSRAEGDVPMTVAHYFPVPMATYNMKSWRRWIFEQCRKVENHELGEWFRIDELRPFAPLHGPGNDPYTIRELETVEEACTDQRGDLTGDVGAGQPHKND